ncbi:hypothetical protein [Paenibacillus sp.]|uniref:hypothetical protein n=1 Tax=Paenibacillus sp. TaxID=58172 RepID=UPI0028125E82|nr:hypothetical protein [Paenibacillus sp.]
MSKERDAFAKLVGRMKREFRRFAGSYASAVKNGAEVAGRRMLEAAEEKDQPPEKLAGKLLDAVKLGAQHAGEQLISAGLEAFERSQERSKSRK